LARSHRNPRVVLGEDTRESSRWLGRAVAAGLASAGVEVESAGVLTTPGVAYLARTGDFAAGVVISASHNPWTDNGIKVFGHDGYKLSDATEVEIEHEIFKQLEAGAAAPALAGLPDLKPQPGLHANYIRWLVQSVDTSILAGLRVAADCAHGAASALVPEVFHACRIEGVVLHNTPDGRNINENCGALHPEVVAKETLALGASIGVTFDGDADRCLFADAEGRVVNGDAILLLEARQLEERGRLKGDCVVATTMSNMGLEAALKTCGIRMLRAPVGDKYVLEEMQRSGAVLGGEQSGHIIFRDGDATTGDGLLTALRVLETVARSRRPLAELKVFPQVIRNVRVLEKKDFKAIPEVAEAIACAERELDGTGRVVVRYSGTESLARVMVEAESEEKMNKCAESIASAIQKALGA
jgi:phosphoglucosamine mutase